MQSFNVDTKQNKDITIEIARARRITKTEIIKEEKQRKEKVAATIRSKKTKSCKIMRRGPVPSKIVLIMNNCTRTLIKILLLSALVYGVSFLFS